jgi:hypothetical protein
MIYVDVVGDCLASGAVLDKGVHGQGRRAGRAKFADRPSPCGRVIGAARRANCSQFEITWQVVSGFDARRIRGADIGNGDRVNQSVAHISCLFVDGLGRAKTGFVCNCGGKGHRVR